MWRAFIVLMLITGLYLSSLPSFGQRFRTIICKTHTCGVTKAYLLKDDFKSPTLMLIDSSLINKDTFEFKIEDQEPNLYYIKFDEEEYKTEFFLDTDIALLLQEDNCYRVEVLNSPLTTEWTTFKQEIVRPFTDTSVVNMAAILELEDKSNSVKTDSLYKARIAIYKHYVEAVASYITTKRSSFLTLYLLKWYSKELMNLGQDYPKRLLDNLDSSLKSTKTYALIREKL